ncbi:MAG: roadblock/LC7 domain-containing protein [Anaerolineales bacterium]|nr:roadblock/LC7 domain-containing protein [Anaerolineales bacterium]
MKTETTPLEFGEILQRMNKEGFFVASVLASEDGLPIASAPTPSPYDADTIAAMVALVKDFIKQTQTRLGLAEVDEVSIFVNDRSRLICRYFDAGAQPFVLTILAPPNQSYRRVASRAVHHIQTAWMASEH